MKQNRCTLLLSIFISASLHVSGNYVPIIRRTYCIYATLVFFTVYGWLSGRIGAHYFLVYLFRLLYVFRATVCPSSGKLTVSMRHWYFSLCMGGCLVCKLTYLLTPWSRVLLEKITSYQLVKKFRAFNGTRKFITAFTSARHVSLS